MKTVDSNQPAATGESRKTDWLVAVAAFPAAGAFGAAGTNYITAKAIERVTGVAMDDGEAYGFSARRGLLLEPAAMHLLTGAWQVPSACTWQPFGTHLGSTL